MTIRGLMLGLCSAIIAVCANDRDIVPTGNGTYEIRVPTPKMPQIALTFTAIGDTPPSEPMRVPDQATVEESVKQQAREYCAKLKQVMVQTGGGFDMGTGFVFEFRCVPPQE